MATTHYIVIRLTPADPLAASDFTSYLEGLTLQVYDASFAHPDAGTPGDATAPLGSATYDDPNPFSGAPTSSPPLTYAAGTTIAQHFSATETLGVWNSVTLLSVATAVIPYTPPAAEYVAPDLRITFTRTGAPTLYDGGVYYDVGLYSSATTPTPDQYQGISAASVAAYVTLPPAPNPNVTQFQLPRNGTPPSFDTLLLAIDAVIAKDPGPSSKTLYDLASGSTQLTADQCRNIAYEILWGPQPALPALPEQLENMYTNPPNNGNSSSSNQDEQNRQSFQGALASFYSTRSAQAEQLGTYVFSAYAAIWCEIQSKAAKKAIITFPVDPGATTGSSLATVAEAQVILNGALGIDVPAQYFYALTAQMPTQVSPAQRYQVVIGADQKHTLDQLTTAIAAGVITATPSAPQPSVNPAQAVRLLEALAVPASSAAVPCQVSTVQPIWTDWMAFPALASWQSYQPGDDETGFWPHEAATQAGPFLNLVLDALTQGAMVGSSSQSLASAILANLLVTPTPPASGLPHHIASVVDLAAALQSDWQAFFALPPPADFNTDLLPPFTLPGSPSARVTAFIRYVRKFFNAGVLAPSLTSATAGGPPAFPLPTVDWLGAVIAQYGGLTFGAAPFSAIDLQNLADAASVVLGDDAAQAWAVQAIVTLNELALCAKVPVTPAADAATLQFSIMEALYARGFTSADSIVARPLPDFRQALTGTVAYPFAKAIYGNAGTPATQGGGATGSFGPINDGTLTNCIPPEHLSPLGPVEYLHELLRLSEASTCGQPFAAPPKGQPTLGGAIEGRRGPLGSLSVTRANLETELPLIDMVNECLEAMASTTPPTNHGVVYDTAGSVLGTHALCAEPRCGEEDRDEACHDPAALFGALPQYSTPGTPEAANAAVEPAVYDILANDFSSCCLPYSQAFDVSRSYLELLGASRFETMRTFKKCITEFVLDPEHEPAGFTPYVWRYPVRIDTAIEYLRITPQEYTQLFHGVMPRRCGQGDVREPVEPPAVLEPGRLDGAVDLAPVVEARTEGAVPLPVLLQRTCLSYCELFELWETQYIPFSNAGADDRRFPKCEPCCLADVSVTFPNPPGAAAALQEIEAFVRLWRILRERCGLRIGFADLADVCTVLAFWGAGSPNPDFVRQLAALRMLVDQFHLALRDPRAQTPANAKGAARTHLLSLWVGPTAPQWGWAVDELVERVAAFAERRHGAKRRDPEYKKVLRDNLDALSRLAGFDPSVATDTWHAQPTHTLRFAEVLAKIYASTFSIEELLYLFVATPPVGGDPPFPAQDPSEAIDEPLSLPDDDHPHSLLRLRRALLEPRGDVDVSSWSWKHVEHTLREDFGYAAADVLALGQQFFPEIARAAGYQGDPAAGRFTYPLAATDTVPTMWNTLPDGPFRYDPTAGKAGALWTQIPLVDGDLIAQLERVRPLQGPEQQAVQSLFFSPRASLAAFGLLFPDFAEAERHLIEERDERARWSYFQRRLAVVHADCHLIVKHLAAHVRSVTRHEGVNGEAEAWTILRDLLADENQATTDWQADGGARPEVTWAPMSGGAFAALLGLRGTGLLGELAAGGTVVWRDVYAGLLVFGRERNEKNCPVPTVVPALGLDAMSPAMKYVLLRNGFAMRDTSGTWLGGAQGFTMKWTGILFVDEEGSYEFAASGRAPAEGSPHGEREAFFTGRAAADIADQAWRVALRRGQRAWVVLDHRPGHEEHPHGRVPLKRGAYEITIELTRPDPDFTQQDRLHALHTGFGLRYSGPDTGGEMREIPRSHLFRSRKDGDLSAGLPGLSPVATTYLEARYTSSLRDIRRTYQRAFKALLFAQRFELSAQRISDGQSELGYLLSQPAAFAGHAYYRAGGGFKPHLADFDFNFLPIGDDYFPPSASDDARTAPSPQRTQALFDWWERSFDYARMRHDVTARSGRHVWLLFNEAMERKPSHTGHLLRHLDADARHWSIDLHYFQDQTTPVYVPTSADLSDERWTLRAWHADRWARAVARVAGSKLPEGRPDLWASLAPSALVAGETQTGNANLTALVGDTWLESGPPRRYQDIARLDDGLRERGRRALLAYLCGPNGIAGSPKEISALILVDVEAGLRERASRIAQAISSVQLFVQRARLGLEPGWTVTHEWTRLWDSRFSSFRVWQASKRRELYQENWAAHHDLERAKEIEAFHFLDEQLRRATLTVAVPGGVDYWPGERPPVHPSLVALQGRDQATMRLLSPSPVSPPRDEGLDLLARPDHDAVPSWLTNVPGPAATGANGQGDDALKRAAAAGSAAPTTEALPLWMQAAIRLGARFVRVAAAAYPPASLPFAPRRAPRSPGAETGVDCCAECGRAHPPRMDEYYFWLVDGRRFDALTQDSYYDPTTQTAAPWEDDTQLPILLEWPSEPTVRLAWCRVHDGQFQPPRRSVEGIEVVTGSGSLPDFAFAGRAGDSLYFTVTGAATTAGSSPGFRYDLAPDHAVTSPSVTVPSAPPQTYPGALMAYPYFAYFEPGARLFPWSVYTVSVAVANALRARCRFEAALKWYELAYDPLQRDNTWIHCGASSEPILDAQAEVREREGSRCCDATDVSCHVAQNRSIELEYVDTLVQWGDALLRHDSAESFERARVVFDTASRIMGPEPRSVRATPSGAPQTVATFEALVPPLNPRLLETYDRLRDRHASIHLCLSSRRLENARLRWDGPYFGEDRARHGYQTIGDACAEADDACHAPSPYRFSVLVQKAQELAGKVRELGASLLAAFEKGDAEYLAALRSQHDREIASLSRRIREDQWRDADWQVQALGLTKESDQASRRYYAGLIAAGLNGNESQYVALTGVSMATRAAGNVIEAIAETMDIIPDLFVGFPCEETQLPVGTKLAGMFKTIARITNTVADITSTTASLDLTEGGWDRRVQEWTHQVEILDIQIEQVTVQILGAERRRDQALRELNSSERQIENAAEVQDFLRDKTTSHALYLWMQKETAELYSRLYELALRAARQAERAYNFERGHTTRRFLPRECWSDLHEGLLAGERLSASLSEMDKAYLDLNVREYELTKHVSLRLSFPRAFLHLKTTGRCEIELPEWLFDLDYPGHYMRRIKSVTLTIPCVTGPYTGVHCRLTLLASATRIEPLLERPAAGCCDTCGAGDGYEACEHDRRIVRSYAARDAIATSSGQNDAGLFELNFRDERYLPFELHGAVSRWRVELPPENNYFDMSTLSDVVLHLSYTAREGGDALRRAAREATERRLPDAGRRGLDVRQELPTEWRRFQAMRRDEAKRTLALPFTRDLFQFLPGHRALWITRVEVFFEAEGADPMARHTIRFAPVRDAREGEVQDIDCVGGAEWEGLLHGVLDVRIGPLSRGEQEHLGELRFGPSLGTIHRLYVVFTYEAPGGERDRGGCASTRPWAPPARR